jgi:hypothetical protein
VPCGEVSHTEGKTGGEGTSEGGADEGSNATEATARVEPADSDAVFFGVDLESWGLAGIAALVSLGLALAVWYRPVRPVFAMIVVLAAVFAGFDLAEVSHQVSVSKWGAAIAAVDALLHLSTSGLAVAGFRSPEAR